MTNRLGWIGKLIAAALLTCSIEATALATRYSFFVACRNSAFVDDWDTGTIDPGREYLRTVVGTKHPGCGISDYNPQNDFGIRHEHHEGSSAVVEGVPFLGQILGDIFGF